MSTIARAAVAIVALALIAIGAAGCGGGGAGGPARPGARIVVTTTQLGDLTRQIAGDRDRIDQILAPNSDPHAFEPRPSDAKALVGADVVIRSGGDVDDWLADVLKAAGGHPQELTIIDFLHARHLDGQLDPHWWENPRDAIVAVARIRDALSAADPAGRAAYAARASAYTARLRALDRAAARCFAAIPAARRKLVTDHDALGYLADRYAVDVIGTVIPALSTQAQASAGAVARLVTTIRAAGVKTIFTEASVNPKLERAIAREAGAVVGPPLYADSLGLAGTPGATYLGSMRFNIGALAAGMGAPKQRCALPR